METYDINANRVYGFRIERAGGLVDVNPVVPTPGLYAHGHARIKKRGSGRRRITWTCEREFSIEIAPLTSDDPEGGEDPGGIWDATPDAPSNSTGLWVYWIDLCRGNGHETVAYKYTVNFDGVPVVDPVIIIDR